MTKRIMALVLALVLTMGCVFALAETVTTEATEEPAAEATAEATEEPTEEAAEEATEETTEETVVEGKTRYICAPSGLYIRAAADLEAEIVATPDFNYAVKVIGEEGKWSHVIYESNDKTYEGYCWTAYLSTHKTVVKAAEKTEKEETPETDVVVG